MTVQGTNRAPELLLRLRRAREAPPLGRQLESALREAIRAGRLRPGDRLPPTRTLAEDVGVSRRLVVEVFEQLRAEGWLDARVGAGTFVRRPLPGWDNAAPPPASPRPSGTDRLVAAPRLDFFPGHPDLSAFPRGVWARETREALRELPDAAFGYGDPRGSRTLRVAICAYLGRARGVACRPGQVIICQGVVQALGILVRATANSSGPVRVAVEDPYLPEHREVLDHAGADVIPVPVDEFGVHDEAIAAARAQLALLTPAHQCPTGVVLSPGRRAALVNWAAASDTLLLEDDYDAEYRYDRAPVAALQALAPDRVVYLGSASKTLSPALRLAWMVVPEDRLEPVVAAKRYADAGSPRLEQEVLARLLTSGAYERHVRGARRRQRIRRDALLGAVARHMPDARVGGIAAGLHAIVVLDKAVDGGFLLERARAHGVAIYPLNLWRADPPPETTGIVLGYGALHPAAIDAGVAALARALAEVR